MMFREQLRQQLMTARGRSATPPGGCLTCCGGPRHGGRAAPCRSSKKALGGSWQQRKSGNPPQL